MSQNYKKKQLTGREYVDATKEFCSTTHYRCEMLPKRWGDTLLLPLVRYADEIETDVCRANRIYINPKNMGPEDLIGAYTERIRLLTEAVTLFADFDVKFDRLMSRIDIAGSEKKRLKSLFYEMLAEERKRNPELKEMDIRMSVKNFWQRQECTVCTAACAGSLPWRTYIQRTVSISPRNTARAAFAAGRIRSPLCKARG